MMKNIRRISAILVVTALLVLIPVGTVLGKSATKIKGTITDLGTNSMVLETKDGPVNVVYPDDYDSSDLELGLVVMVDGSWLNEENFQADAIKILDDQDEMEEEDLDDEQETEEVEESEFTSQNAFCTGEKDRLHPLATKIVERFAGATTEDQIMEWFCEGHSFGQIMLALMTQKFDGTDPEDLLQMRKGGKGWGIIWKEKGLIGNEKEGTPPGHIIKPDKGTPPGLEKNNMIPPGLLKKTPTP
ncbi:MAG: hypothetical protein P8046_06250 [Anaerolineales bacterium]